MTRPSSHRTRTMSPSRSIAAGTRALQEGDAASEERVLEHRGNFGVLDREHLLARHEQRDLRPERVEEVRELHAGDAGADHDRVLGDLGRRIGVAGGEDPLAVDGDEVGYPGPRPGADHHEVGGDLLEPARRSRPRSSCGSLKRAVPLITRTCCDSRPGEERAVQPVLDRRDTLAQRVDVETALRPRCPSSARGRARAAHRRWRSAPSTGCSPTGARHHRRCRVRRG